jgi:hypothetical protein
MTRLRALTLEEYLDSLGISYIDDNLDDSGYVLSLLVLHYTNITTNPVATYIALETMFKFGWEMSELVRLTSIRTLTTIELMEANRHLLGAS